MIGFFFIGLPAAGRAYTTKTRSATLRKLPSEDGFSGNARTRSYNRSATRYLEKAPKRRTSLSKRSSEQKAWFSRAGGEGDFCELGEFQKSAGIFETFLKRGSSYSYSRMTSCASTCFKVSRITETAIKSDVPPRLKELIPERFCTIIGRIAITPRNSAPANVIRERIL